MRCLAVLALLAGCSGGIDMADYRDAVRDAACRYYKRCGAVASDADCRAFFDRLALDDPNPAAAVDMNKLAYAADAAQSCVDAYGKLSCDSTQLTRHELDVCNEVFTGLVKTGSPCGFSTECESGACAKQSCQMACCLGTCVEPTPEPDIGQPCTFACKGDAYCGADSICHERLPQGAACSDEVCAYGLYCRGLTSTTSGACAPIPHLGEPCETECAELGSVCAGTCVAAGLLGDSCAASACSFFYECSAQQCVALPTGGMPCTGACADGFFCQVGTVSSTCVEQLGSGGACMRNDQCLTHYCERIGATGTCADVPVCI